MSVDTEDIIIWSIPDISEPDDKYLQEFKEFLRERGVQKWIRSLRKRGKIKTGEINRRMGKFQKLIDKQFKVSEKVSKYLKEKGLNFKTNPSKCFEVEKKLGYSALQKEAHDYADNLVRDLNSKIAIDDVRMILSVFSKPFSWEGSLLCYMLTGKIITPSVRCEIVDAPDRERKKFFYLKIYSETTIRDVKGIWSRVEKAQEFLSGHSVKDKRYKKRLENNLEKARDWAEYQRGKKCRPREWKDPATGEYEKAPDIDRMELVDMYFPDAFDNKKKRKRALNSLRKTHQRYKRPK